MRRVARTVNCCGLVVACLFAQPLLSADGQQRTVARPLPSSAGNGSGSLRPPDGPADLETLIGFGLANNPQVRAARFDAQARWARVPQVRSLPDPTLVTTAFLEQIQTAAGPQEVALSLSQKFPWFGKRALRGQVAHYDAMAAASRLSSTELLVVEQIKHGYFELYFLQQAASETQRLEEPLNEVISIAQSRFETSSVFQAQIELAKLKTELIRLEESKRRAQAQLAATLHLAPDATIEAVGPLRRSHPADEVKTLIALAESWQPALEASRRELARDRAGVALARRQYWPDVTMSVNWYEMGSGGLSPVATGQDAFSIGVGVNLPIRRSRLAGAVREAESQLRATARRQEQVRDRFQAQIQVLLADFREHARTLEILNAEILPRAEETLNLALGAYRAGRLDFQQLIDVYRTLLEFRIELHRRVTRSEQAVASLERAVGCALTSPPLETGAPADR